MTTERNCEFCKFSETVLLLDGNGKLKAKTWCYRHDMEVFKETPVCEESNGVEA